MLERFKFYLSHIGAEFALGFVPFKATKKTTGSAPIVKA